VVRLFLQHGADLQAMSKDGWTPMNEAIGHERLSIVRMLLEKGGALVVSHRYTQYR
jgi:ankyrin repeat protein